MSTVEMLIFKVMVYRQGDARHISLKLFLSCNSLSLDSSQNIYYLFLQSIDFCLYIH